SSALDTRFRARASASSLRLALNTGGGARIGAAAGGRGAHRPPPRLACVSLDNLWHQIEAGLGLRGNTLEHRSLVRLADLVITQAQARSLRMRHRLDATRVDRLELVDQSEDGSQLSENLFCFGVVDLQAGELRDASNVVQGQQHGDG